jgi:hypothetical protein
MVQDMLGQSANIIAIAKATNLSRQTVYRIKDDPAAAEAKRKADFWFRCSGPAQLGEALCRSVARTARFEAQFTGTSCALGRHSVEPLIKSKGAHGGLKSVRGGERRDCGTSPGVTACPSDAGLLIQIKGPRTPAFPRPKEGANFEPFLPHGSRPGDRKWSTRSASACGTALTS